MSVGWVAGTVRARAMTRRRLGAVAVRELAASPSVDVALLALANTPYGHDVRESRTLADAQRAVVAAVVWNVRVLSGWVPRDGVTILRVLLGAVEVANVEDHLLRLAGEESPSPYRLGGLATAWPRVARTASADEVRRVLTGSPWGDPGNATPRAVGLAMRTSLADRTMAAVPAAGAWAAGAVALLVAREVVVGRRQLPARAQIAAARVVGPLACSAGTLPELASVLPTSARWALDGVREPGDLWQAEARWWARVERDGFAFARSATADPQVLVGTVAVMAADAWRVRAALELAARGGTPLEAFDAVA